MRVLLLLALVACSSDDADETTRALSVADVPTGYGCMQVAAAYCDRSLYCGPGTMFGGDPAPPTPPLWTTLSGCVASIQWQCCYDTDCYLPGFTTAEAVIKCVDEWPEVDCESYPGVRPDRCDEFYSPSSQCPP